jgi:hypothetical protein
MNHHAIRTVSIVLLVPLLLGTAGCTSVRANQKQRLADPIMTFDHDHVHSEMMGHILTPREGAIGGFSAVGAGGCGCN